MKIYIDVTNIMSVNFISGIQRVVREVLLEMFKTNEFELVLLSYENNKECYEILDNNRFIKFFGEGKGRKNEIKTHFRCCYEDIHAGDVFFDIDSVWNSRLRRSEILPILKEHGVKIAVMIYDIIPITHPQYCHENTIYFFMNYLGAHLQYADTILTSAETTKNEIGKLQKKLGLEETPCFVTSLGAEFTSHNKSEESVSKEIIKTANKKRYILTVGTIEPRKNHKVLLDAFDQELFNEDINIIFAGRIGWNVTELEQRIRNHPQLDKRFFFIQSANNAEIDYLYSHAYIVVFPTYNEGFGLPLIESIKRKTPVLASNCDVLKEIGGEYCEYFNPDNVNELISLVKKYLHDKEHYAKYKNNLINFKIHTWKEVSNIVVEAIQSLKSRNKLSIKSQIKQMVILSARENDLLETLPFIEAFMPFIKELIICCPDEMIEKVKCSYNGKLAINFLSDSDVLAGNSLPEDHQKRNFYLRCLAINSNILDDVFIMGDDDNRPLFTIEEEVYIKNGKYQAYYFSELRQWKGTEENKTSYDIGIGRTYEFLKEKKYPCLQYSSHMPQIIDKRIFKDMLQRYPDIINMGFDEWSIYFNYGMFHYTNLFEPISYITISWPAATTDWDLKVYPKKFLFENFYPELYNERAIFEGFSTKYYKGIEKENYEKISIYMNSIMQHERDLNVYSAYNKLYYFQYKNMPSFSLVYDDYIKSVIMPKYLNISPYGCTRINFYLYFGKNIKRQDKSLKIGYFYTELNGDRLTMPDYIDINADRDMIELPIFGLKYKGDYLLHIKCKFQDSLLENHCFIIL